MKTCHYCHAFLHGKHKVAVRIEIHISGLGPDDWYLLEQKKSRGEDEQWQ